MLFGTLFEHFDMDSTGLWSSPARYMGYVKVVLFTKNVKELGFIWVLWEICELGNRLFLSVGLYAKGFISVNETYCY